MLFVNLNASMSLHQVALADALYEILGNDFVFIKFGRNGKSQCGSFSGMCTGVDFNRPYILDMHASPENEQFAKELIQKADVVRAGGPPFELIRQRLLDKKLTFSSGERLFKGPLWKDILRITRMYNYARYANANFRILCQSAFKAYDFRLLGNIFRNKCYRFAYFVQTPQIDIEQTIVSRRTDKVLITWCGRFISWKRPDLIVQLAQRLIQSGRENFEIQMIGANTTPLWDDINLLIRQKKLYNYITLTGGLHNTEVLARMRDSHIFISTSDRQEGWGVVVNEAMCSGCACVVPHKIGSAPFLIKHNENGLIYKTLSEESLFMNVAKLYDNPKNCELLARNAYHTITGEWSAKNAAFNLLHLSQSILDGQEITIEHGPCSRQEPLSKISFNYLTT